MMTSFIGADGSVMEIADNTENVRDLNVLLGLSYSDMNNDEIEAVVTYRSEIRAGSLLAQEHSRVLNEEIKANAENAKKRAQEAEAKFYALIGKDVSNGQEK